MAKESKQYHSVTVNIILFTILILVLLLTVFLILPLFWNNDWHDYPDPQRASATATTAIANMEQEMNKVIAEYKTIMDRFAKDEVVFVQDGDLIKAISKPGQPDANKVLMTIPVKQHEVPKGIFPEQ